MINDDLENLLNRYINGELSFTAYRQQRNQLLREFIAEKKPDVTIPKKSDPKLVEQKAIPKSTTFNVPTIEREEPLSSAKRIQITIVTGLLGLAIGAWLLSQNSNNANSPIDPLSKLQMENVKTITNEPFIEEFVNKAIWDSETLSDFLIAWQGLSSERQELAKKSTAFKQMHKELKLKMNTASRLKNIGDKEAEKQEQLLIWFATQMSIGAV